LTEAFLFTANTDFGYHISIIANAKFMDVFFRPPTKSHVPWPHVAKSGCGLRIVVLNFLLFALALQIISVECFVTS